MIPIMQKNYIDGMKSALKKWKIEQRLMGTQYAEATLNFYAADSERAVDSITNIFLDQIAASELNLEAHETLITYRLLSTTMRCTSSVISSRSYQRRRYRRGGLREGDGES